MSTEGHGTADGVEAATIVPFPARACFGIELVVRLAPSRSMVETLVAERDDEWHDVQAGFAREFAYQARALEAGHGRDGATVLLRRLVDAHVAQAVVLCRGYQDAADVMVRLEIEVAQGSRRSWETQTALSAARHEVQGRAIAARAAADAALGAASALASYIRVGVDGLAVSAAEPRQLLLFAAVG